MNTPTPMNNPQHEPGTAPSVDGQMPPDLAPIAALLDRAAAADHASARSGLEARLFRGSMSSLLAGDAQPAAAALREEHARILDSAPHDLEEVTFDRSRGGLPGSMPLSAKRHIDGRSLRTVWRVAAAIALVGSAGVAYVASQRSAPHAGNGGVPMATSTSAEEAELAALDTLELLEDAFIGDQLDALMAEAAGLERSLQGGLIDDETVEKGAL
ncbi:MAG: hypothetical protein ACT4PL_14370 [Phycisphaerales bacterium]